ncbi:MAG: glutamate synthase subunit beta [Fimbriimonadaceae bacterium]|nr:glutamate synthase subunit beta [Fimbriimonadaceae bacterium]
MGKVTGFIEYSRENERKRSARERVSDWQEVALKTPESKVRVQAARCMDCGVPFCQPSCPVNNSIPDWNDLVYQGRWRDALESLHATNNFPEFTGRICPAPCEAGCVLAVNEPAVAIKLVEKSIVDMGFDNGWVEPRPASKPTGKSVAVVGSGPAGLAASQQLARAGHAVTLFDKAARPGGLLRYGIPNFKLEKHLVDRRFAQLEAEGVVFRGGVHVGVDITGDELRDQFDAVLLACGAEAPRDVALPGRDLKGIHFAMDFLTQANRRCEGEEVVGEPILAEGKHVVIIGGGDTGADCLGTSLRQGAASVRQIELMPMPPVERSSTTPWPLWPLMLRTESSHEEGGQRYWGLKSTNFVDDGQGRVAGLRTVQAGPPPDFEEKPNSERVFEAGLVLLAVGFRGPVLDGLVAQLGLETVPGGGILTQTPYATPVEGVFTAGDMRRGQSLVVWAVREGREAAAVVDSFLRR